MTDKLIEDRYIGDGVYVSYDGWMVWLDTRAQEPVNRIALEPEVMEALYRYVDDVRAANKATQEELADGK